MDPCMGIDTSHKATQILLRGASFLESAGWPQTSYAPPAPFSTGNVHACNHTLPHWQHSHNILHIVQEYKITFNGISLSLAQSTL